MTRSDLDMTPVTLFRAVDRAAFVVALGSRLRAAGVPVSLTALAAFTDALGLSPVRDRGALYWTARVTLVGRPHHLPAFDAVFRAVFEEAALPVTGRASGPQTAPV